MKLFCDPTCGPSTSQCALAEGVCAREAELEHRVEVAVLKVELDIKDRRGLKWEWDQIGDDVKQEIRQAWRNIILRELVRP